MIAAAHLTGAVTIPIALLLTMGLWLYWRMLSRPAVPPGRRLIRRTSLMLMFISLPLLVWAMSFIDPARQQQLYVIVWSVIFLLVLLVFLSASVDGLHSLALHRQQAERDMVNASAELFRSMKSREANDESHDADPPIEERL